MDETKCHYTAFGLIVIALIAAMAAANAAGAASQALQQQPLKSEAVEIEDNDRAMAELWGLSLKEWHRYEKLRQGIAQYRSDKLDPLTLLGINARSAAERRKYAERLARMAHERMERILAFQQAYTQAFERLYPNEPRIATDSTAQRTAHILTRGRQAARHLGLMSQRLTVFVRVQNCADCRQTVKRLAEASTPMDIFVVGADSDDAIRQWATRVGLDPVRVRSGAITLNHAPDKVADQLAGADLPRIMER